LGFALRKRLLRTDLLVLRQSEVRDPAMTNGPQLQSTHWTNAFYQGRGAARAVNVREFH